MQAVAAKTARHCRSFYPEQPAHHRDARTVGAASAGVSRFAWHNRIDYDGRRHWCAPNGQNMDHCDLLRCGAYVLSRHQYRRVCQQARTVGPCSRVRGANFPGVQPCAAPRQNRACHLYRRLRPQFDDLLRL